MDLEDGKVKRSWSHRIKESLKAIKSLPAVCFVVIALYAAHMLITGMSGRHAKFFSVNDEFDEHQHRDAAFIKRILSDSLAENMTNTKLSDIVGQNEGKEALLRSVLWPLLNPQLFKGLREAAPGCLLYGPPGTGKTMLARAIANQLKPHSIAFFNVTASTFAARYHGDGERLVRCLFKAARDAPQGAIIFIDEIDSIMGARHAASEDDAMRRLKTELLICLDGMLNTDQRKVILIASTNMPHLLDPAFLRRCGRRVHVRLPGPNARTQQLKTLLANERHSISDAELSAFSTEDLKGYSPSDIKNVAREAAMAALDEIVAKHASITSITPFDLPPIRLAHLKVGKTKVQSSLPVNYLKDIELWEQSMINTKH